MTCLLFSPKSLSYFYETANLEGLEGVWGYQTSDLPAFLPQVVWSLLRDGKLEGSGAGFGGTKQETCLLFSPKSFGHFYETANLGGFGAGFGGTKQASCLLFSPKSLGDFGSSCEQPWDAILRNISTDRVG